MTTYYGAIEAGGTKFVVAVADQDYHILERVSIPTTEPDEVFEQIFQVFSPYPLEAIGVGSFGPIDVNVQSKTYGYITTTPKTKWQHTNFLGRLKEKYPDIPLAWTTDVNAAAYGELKQGAGADVDSCMYITVGTGIGGGLVMDGQVVHGFQHPEVGHMQLMCHDRDLNFAGVCPYHGARCAEGLASGPSIEARWGKKGHELAGRVEVWGIEAYYLAQLIYNVYLTTSIERFILGGGVMKQSILFPLIRQAFNHLNQGYVDTPDLEDFIQPPALGDNPGIIGCFELAQAEVAMKK